MGFVSKVDTFLESICLPWKMIRLYETITRASTRRPMPRLVVFEGDPQPLIQRDEIEETIAKMTKNDCEDLRRQTRNVGL